MCEDLIVLISRLADELAMMQEICYLPEDVDEIVPDGVDALRQAKRVIIDSHHSVPATLAHWMEKLDGLRPN